MEIRELAESVLFSPVLEEKLRLATDSFTDDRPGRAIVAPDTPGRPDNLVMRAEGMRSSLPRRSQLEDESDRGRLLHFFANHELLAAELMALVLLKFPDAPPEFRLGVARTLREEQEHTRLYIERMKACGVAFGSLPVNGFFWKAVSGMETPIDYISRLSLTFEQANLDYARHFSEIFRRAGDPETSRLLARIYRDEIGHVGYGLQWFRRWKDPSQSDWTAYRDQLPFPLSPNRAKGSGPFNRRGRLRAGLDDDFIKRLEVYSQSKGRIPNVFHFNPEAEWVIAQAGEKTAISESLRLLSEDLSSLTLFLARRDDVALLHRRPSLAFLQTLQDAGFALPEIHEREALDLQGRKLGRLRPWALSPDSLAFLGPLRPQSSRENRLWEPDWRELYSKAWSTRLLRDIEQPFGQVCESVEEVMAVLRVTPRPAVLKSPFGIAGKDMVHLTGPEWTDKERAWAASALKTQGSLVVEPWLQRALDFSVQYEMEESGAIRLVGYTRLHNDPSGRFKGCSTGRSLTFATDADVPPYFHGGERLVQRFYKETLLETLQCRLAPLAFSGPLGVDAFLYRDAGGALRHHPLTEINPRYTMGRVALELARHAVQGERVLFQILTRKDLRARGQADFVALSKRLTSEHPVRTRVYQNDVRRLAAGTLPLNDPAQARAYLAILRVGPDATLL